MPSSYIPSGFTAITPYLIVNNAAALIDFLKSAFDAQEISRMGQPGEGIVHAALEIGGAKIEVADANSDWPATPTSIHLYVPDTDHAYQRALQAGAVSLRAPEDMFYGERGASVQDPVGNHWHIATLIEELSSEEVKRRARDLGLE